MVPRAARRRVGLEKRVNRSNDMYDLVVVGGGLAGASLAKSMVEHGARVLVIEREKRFRDRVRGEGLHPWGVAEARRLGIYEPLLERCAHEAHWLFAQVGPLRVTRRNLVETTSHRAGSLDFHHPEMQEALLDLAARSGAEVIRGATVIGVSGGPRPTVRVRNELSQQEYAARLVVGADGRDSMVRSSAGFTVSRDPEHLLISSTLFTGMPLSDEAVRTFTPLRFGQSVMMFPLSQNRMRSRRSRSAQWQGADCRLHAIHDRERCPGRCVRGR